MAVLTISCYGLLMIYFVPLPHSHMMHSAESAFNTHVLGMFFGFIISAGIIAYFIVQMAQVVRRRDEMLARIREEILRNEHIVALGTQAASAAHEMGTPLSTMAVLITELQHDTAAQPEWQTSLSILDEQVRGCKRILDRMLANSSSGVTLQKVDQFVAEILDEWQLLRPTAQYHYRPSDSTPIPYIKTDITLRAALMNLLNNAADAATPAIEIGTSWDTEHCMLSIHDQGSGLDNEVAGKAGSAFFTTKSEGRGLGLYLANATIERRGGSIRLFNRAQGGATTEIILPVSWEQV
jgi:two-component system sensor histidine kinase RegB